jgi:hypothetical protein
VPCSAFVYGKLAMLHYAVEGSAIAGAPAIAGPPVLRPLKPVRARGHNDLASRLRI